MRTRNAWSGNGSDSGTDAPGLRAKRTKTSSAIEMAAGGFFEVFFRTAQSSQRAVLGVT
ncbi:hypothetical protein [Paenibacillus chitinolyticus]|uniref:hypothetical protein n=1 Tax=Paenibacillus chitinolyticus TaxID=79263 RepID=UPI00295E4A4B|nr:hypothetical protein [Paenibacillus chitinolyticus]